MNRILAALMMLNLTGAAVTRAADAAGANTLVWCGLDYSLVKMIGTADFHQPGEIFPGMLEEWNSLFMKEMLPQLQKMAPAVETDLSAVEARNLKANPSQIEREDGTRREKVDATHITEKDLAKTVRAYKLKHAQGLGLVFIMDRLVKAQETGCLYVVFFDIASRKIGYSERVCAPAGGFGFRNFWFRPIKNTVAKLPAMYQQATAKQ
jgi:hypothetical protein